MRVNLMFTINSSS